ncbi:MAG TPA: Crp/Fnr family transcriptional regulator [Candidatus Saccharimonadales bacterium]|nr:Crp/Fnr family transcriptional regulator [Candidatus Saccharimonadales bacterium]
MEKLVEQKLDTFFSQFRTVHFKKGDIIISASDHIDYLYYLKKGFVKQSFVTEDGEEITHHIFKPISYFPIMLVLSDMPNKYVFTAMEALEVQKAPTDKVITFLEHEPDVLFDLTKRFSTGLSKLLTKNEQMLFKDAYTKVASILVYLAKRFGEEKDNQIVITIPLTHTDLASWLGMQRETVSRQIEKLQKKEAIQYKGSQLTITNLEILEQESIHS